MDNYQLLGFAEQVYNVMFEFVTPVQVVASVERFNETRLTRQEIIEEALSYV